MVIRALLRRPEGVWQPAVSRVRLWRIALPTGVVLAVFKLALSDGGRHAETLMSVQIVMFAMLAVAWMAGGDRHGLLVRGIGAVLLAIAASSVGSVRIEASLRQLLLWMMYGGIALVTAAPRLDQRARERVLDGLTLIAGWLCLIALFMFWGAGNASMRWYSTFYWPNPFAAFLLLLLPLSMARAVHAPTLRGAISHGAMSVLLGVSLVLTYSRGAWLIAAVMLPLAGVLSRPGSWSSGLRRGLAVAIGVGAAVVLLVHAVPAGVTSNVVERAASIADPAADVSIQGRVHFWRSALAVFADHPLVGTGAGTFEAVHSAYQTDPRFYARDPHNVYLQLAAEMGIVGLAAAAFFLVSLVRLWFRVYARGNIEERAVAAGIGVGLLAFLLHSGLDMDWFFPANPAMAFALVGVLATMEAPGSLDASTVEIHSRWKPGRRMAGQLGVLLLATGAAGMASAFLAAHTWFVTGKMHAREGRWDRAAHAYGRAVRWNPLNSAYRGAQAVAWMQVLPGMRTEPERALRRAMSLDRMNASHPIALGYYLATYSHQPAALDAAMNLARMALRLDPRNRPEAYRLLARLHLERGEQDEALAVYRLAGRQYAGAHLASGMQYTLLWPEVVRLYEEWAYLAARAADSEEAIEVLTRLLREDPSWAPGYEQLATIHLRQGDQARADEVLRAGLDRVPAYDVLWVRWRTLPQHRSSPWPL